MDKIGACGDNCSFCLRYEATISNDEHKLNRVKELWAELGWRDSDVDAQALKCSGCKKENRCAYRELRDCAFGKGLDNCGMCSSYPCALIQSVFEKTENTFRSIKNIGSKDEMDSLVKAFRNKKSNLDAINTSYFANNNSGPS